MKFHKNSSLSFEKWCYGGDRWKGSLLTVNTKVKSVLTRNVTVRFDVSVAVVVVPCCWHRSLLLLLLLVVVMHGDNHQSTVLRSIRTHVWTFHSQNVSEHRRTLTVHPLAVHLHKTPTGITIQKSTSVIEPFISQCLLTAPAALGLRNQHFAQSVFTSACFIWFAQ
jgi:hypothetical protein